MGFHNKPKSNATYTRPADGGFIVRCQEGDEGAFSRTITSGKNKGNIVWEKKYPYLDGHLVDAYIEPGEGQMSSSLVLKIHDKPSKMDIIINCFANSRYAKGFYARCGNIKLSQPLILSPYSLPNQRNPAGANIVGWNMCQGGQKKENIIQPTVDQDEIPKGVEKKKPGGGKVWDDEAQMEFLLDIFDKWREETGIGQKKEDEGDDDLDEDDGGDDGEPF